MNEPNFMEVEQRLYRGLSKKSSKKPIVQTESLLCGRVAASRESAAEFSVERMRRFHGRRYRV